jgi:nucleotide-binding universal stress UspA family protein
MATAIDYARDPLALIVVATDFSPTASQVLERALDLARRHESEIALVHVVQPDLPILASPEMMVVPPDYESRLREASREVLEREATRVRAAGIPVSTHLEHGVPAQRITERANALDADLIAIGARGHTRFEHLLLGSVVESVVRTARQPVLTIHPDDRRPVEPVGTLLFPTDLSADAESVLYSALHLLARSPESRILLVHAFHLAASVVPFTGFGDAVPPLFRRERSGARRGRGAAGRRAAAPPRASGRGGRRARRSGRGRARARGGAIRRRDRDREP